jgi:hypothetical protein
MLDALLEKVVQQKEERETEQLYSAGEDEDGDEDENAHGELPCDPRTAQNVCSVTMCSVAPFNRHANNVLCSTI